MTSDLQSNRRTGFTLTEVMVVIGLIVVILAILLPALNAVRTQSLMANSMSNMRQIAAFMQMYSSDNRDTIVPSQFDYSEATYQGKVRSEIYPEGTPAERGEVHEGTWADILWTENELGPIDPGLSTQMPSQFNYQYCVPDKWVYEADSGYRESPFRSMALNRRNAGGVSSGPTPYGFGAQELGLPGYFAANDFFNARPDAPDYDDTAPPASGRWFANGQIRAPERSMYLVDSFAGYVIDPIAEPYDNIPDPATGDRTIEVDFRYTGNALMLFLDGHVDPVNPWDDLEHLEGNRGIRVTNLDKR